jgi:hypothetical protein
MTFFNVSIADQPGIPGYTVTFDTEREQLAFVEWAMAHGETVYSVWAT